eukprot:2516486-Amphidinium_carterae.1
MPWSELLAKAKSNSSFATDFKAAKKELLKRAPTDSAMGDSCRQWLGEELSQSVSSFLRMSRSYVFMTIPEFEKKYNVKV